MSEIILPGRPGWFGMVSPREEEMPDFLKVIAQGWRTPKRKWEDLWRLRRGDLNHVLGMRQHSGPKYQRGVIGATARRRVLGVAAGGTMPDLTDVDGLEQNSAPAQSRISLWYDSDGGLEWYQGTGGVGSVLYSPLTTQSADANDHTSEWWPDQPDVNEGLNWDIRYLNEELTGSGGILHYFQDTVGPTHRVSGTWYLLDTVSNDAADATDEGSMGVNRSNGTAKSPNVGLATLDVDVEIRATGSGSAVASHHCDFTVEGT